MPNFAPEDFLLQDSYFMRCAQARFLANLEAGMSGDQADPIVSFYFFQRRLEGWPFFTVSNHEQVMQHMEGLCRHGIHPDVIQHYAGKKTHGQKDYDLRFLAHLKQADFSRTSYAAIPEGNLIGGNIPLGRITGPLSQVASLESFDNGALGSGMAWSSMVSADYFQISKELGIDIQYVDFGMRGTNPAATPWMSRSAYVGGTVGTSNEYAAFRFGLPERGTMFHGYILSFMEPHDKNVADGKKQNGEYESFVNYGRANPQNAVFLVDTCSIQTGMVNAIAAAKTLQGRWVINSGSTVCVSIPEIQPRKSVIFLNSRENH